MANDFVSVAGQLTLVTGDTQADRRFCLRDETNSYLCRVGGVLIIDSSACPRGGPQLAARYFGHSRTHLFGPDRPGDSRSTGDAARTACAPAGIFAGGRSALVGDLVHRGGVQIRHDDATA